MNYRHAYHAGNHTEVFKHSVLCILLDRLRDRPKPFTVLDTHAGAGLYDLQSPEALKTNEAAEGIGRVFDERAGLVKAYVEIVRQQNPQGLRQYPGSPEIIRRTLRSNDRLIACELREDDFARLKAWSKNDKRVAVHNRDGYQAISALVPPSTRRGLVFVDPPFENKDEFETLSHALNAGIQKWSTGVFLAWYPIKDPTAGSRIQKIYSRFNPPTLNCEFLREVPDRQKLAGSGLVICNPPWKLDQVLPVLCEDLKAAIGSAASSYRIDWWIKE